MKPDYTIRRITDWYPQDKDTNEHFARRVSLAEAYRCGVVAGAEAEREECAKVCEAQGEYGWQQYAAAIRARSQA